MKKNILWICADQQRFDTLGCTGNKFVKTPNIDRLAKMGMLFGNAYSQSPVCAPSRASMLSGRYPRTCGVRQNGQDISKDEVLIPKLFANNGYMCGMSGKFHLSACNNEKQNVIIEPAISENYHFFRWSHHPSGTQDKTNWAMNEYTMWLTSKGINYKDTPRNDCSYISNGMEEEHHQSTWCTDSAIQCIESAKNLDLPWLFTINYFDPHHPFNPPEKYLERYLDILDDIPLPNYLKGELDTKPIFQQRDHMGAYDSPGSFAYDNMTEKDHKMVRAAYWAMIDLLDVQVGRLLDYLEKTNQLDNTVIIFTSDHGEQLGDHGIYLKGPYMYDAGVKVPLIMACPEVIPPEQVSDSLVELVDIAPTLCEIAGIEKPHGIQGKSLLPHMQGKEKIHRDSIYSEYYNSNIKHRNPKAFVTMVRNDKYKLVRIHDKYNQQKIVCELYDLVNDPNETVNQSDNPKYNDIKMNLLELLCDRMAETCDPSPERKSFW